MATLQCLSNEIVHRIGDFLGDKDLSHFGRVNLSLSQILAGNLIKRSVEPKPPRIRNVHALIWAIDFGHTSLVKRIVSQPYFSRFENDTRSAMYLACELGHTEIISVLVGAGYWVSEETFQKLPLHVCVKNGHAASAKRIIEHGASIHATDRNGKTAFTLALLSGKSIFKKLRGVGPMSASREDQLKNSVENRVLETLRVLVEMGARLELLIPDRVGDTPLHQAVYACLSSVHDINVGTGIMRYLIEQGANIHAQNSDDNTPLELSVELGSANLTALNFFLNLGASPNFKDASGNSLLSKAIFTDTGRNLPIVHHLLNRGATADDLNLWNFFHDTDRPDPVVFDRLLSLLLIHGATFGPKADQCFTIAALHGMLDVMKVVYHHGATINTAVHLNASRRHKETPIEVAIRLDRRDMMKFLVDREVRMTDAQKIWIGVVLRKDDDA